MVSDNAKSVHRITEELLAKIAELEKNRDEAIALADSWLRITYSATAGRMLAQQFKAILVRPAKVDPPDAIW